MAGKKVVAGSASGGRATTIAAMRELREGVGTRFATVEDLMDEAMANPSADEIAAAEKRGLSAGAVGYDDQGLVRREHDGSLSVLDQ